MKKIRLVTSALLLGLFLFSGCTSSEKETANTDTSQSSASKLTKEALNELDLPQLENEVDDEEAVIEIVTSKGTIKAKLFPEYAPKAVENFITHAKNGYYNNTTFHRVIDEFMIQGGDPKGDGTGGESIWNENFAPEISPNLYHIRGALAMARTSGDVKEKTQSSQFYIVENDKDMSDGLLNTSYPQAIIDAYRNGGTPDLDKQYAVFGQVIEGMDVVDAIGAMETDENDKPKEDVRIEKINVLQEASETD